MLPYNLHSHTIRCGHAVGEDEEYVLAAIKAGFKELGFSDHVFLPGVYEPKVRGDFSCLEDYIRSVNALKEKYKDQIKIYLGFEAEWCGERFRSYYRDLLDKYGFDYLILGQHSYAEGEKMTHYYWQGPEDGPNNYVRALLEGMESGLFTYVAHPDIYVYWCRAWNELAIRIAEAIASTSKRLNIPLEVNCGWRSRLEEIKQPDCLVYPSHLFWDVVSKHGCPVVIGVDAHDPLDYQITQYDFYEDFCKQHNLNLLTERPAFRK